MLRVYQKSESEEAISWLQTNHIFANRDKFQAIVVHHNENINENYTLKVNNIETESKNSVKLLRTKIFLYYEKRSLSVTCNIQTTIPFGYKEKRNSYN